MRHPSHRRARFAGSATLDACLEIDDDWRAVAGTRSVAHGLPRLAISGRMRLLPGTGDPDAGAGTGTVSSEEIVRVLR